MINELTNRNVAAFDIAPKHTGVYLYIENASYTITADTPRQRFLQFADALVGVDIAVIEGYALMGNRLAQIAETVGIFKAICSMNKTSIITVPIMTWKSYNQVIGHKKDVFYIKEAQEKHGIGFKTADEVDAYYIWRTALHADELPNDKLRQAVGEAIK